MSDADLSFPVVIAEYEGHTLSLEVSDGRHPHSSPPNCFEVWLRRPSREGGKPGVSLVNQSICRFFKNFDAEEEITTTQAERNALRTELEEARSRERELHTQNGQLKRRVKELEQQLSRDRNDVLCELAQAQIKALTAKTEDNA